MTLTKSTRYALHAALAMARAGEAPITVSQVARQYGIPEGALAKVFQRLVRAGLAVGIRGLGGGYRLARGPAAVSVLDIVDVFEPPPPEDACLVARFPDRACPEIDCRLRTLFDAIDADWRRRLGAVSLAELAGAPGTAATAP